MGTHADPNPSAASRWASLQTHWLRWTQPAPGLATQAERGRARLLAGLCLVLLPLTAAASAVGPLISQGVFDRSPAVHAAALAGWTAVPVLLGAYALSRSRHAAWGSGLLVALAMAVPLMAARLLPLEEGPAFTLPFLALPVMLAGVLLRPTGTLATGIAALLAVALYPILDPRLAAHQTVTPFILLCFVVAFVLAYVLIRNRVQREADLRLAAAHRAENLASLGTLVAGVAHEVGNPLQYIQGSIESARGRLETRQPPDPEATEALDRALLGLYRLEQLVATVRGLVNNRPQPEARIEVVRCVRTVADLARPGLPRGVRLDVHRHHEGPLPVVAEAGAIHGALLNLLRNALDVLRGRGGTVTLSVARHERQVEVTVADDGPGIPAHELAHIFTPFHTTKPDGMGMGLPITHNLIENAGGSLTVESTLGQGTVFTVTLPLASRRAGAPVPARRAQIRHGPARQDRRRSGSAPTALAAQTANAPAAPARREGTSR